MSATAELLKRREDYFRVTAIPNQWGGYDVALVLDSGYADLKDALWHADDFKRQIEEALRADGMPYGVPLDSVSGRPQIVDGSVEEQS